MAINKNYKQEMINKVNEFLAECENGNADMSLLESMAEILIQSARLEGYDMTHVNDHVDNYCQTFDPADLTAAVKAVKEEVEAA